MALVVLVYIAFAGLAAAITAGVFWVSSRAGIKGWKRMLGSALLSPVFLLSCGILSTIYDTAVDGPPPGMVLLGILSLFVAMIPVTLFAAFRLTKLESKRAPSA